MVAFQKIILVPAIAADGIKQYLFSSKELKAGIRRHGYYNHITVTNGGEIDIQLQLGSGKKYSIVEGGFLELSNLKYDEISIINKNSSYATVLSTIEIVCSVEGI